MLSTQRLRKSKATCLQCRARKVRCDGQPEICSNCRRLGFDCSFQCRADSESSALRAMPVAVRLCRVPMACAVCRVRKVKCSGERPSCQNCIDHGQPCTYDTPRPRTARRSTTASTPQTDQLTVFSSTTSASEISETSEGRHHDGVAISSERSSVGPTSTVALDTPLSHTLQRPPIPPPFSANPLNNVPPRDTIRRSIKRYTEYIYPLPRFSFIHAPTLNAAVSSGDVEPALVFAVCGTSALYAPAAESTATLARAWMETAEDLLMKALGRPSLQRLQALLLVILHRLESRDFSKAFMLVAFAARAAFALRLNYEPSHMTFEQQEIRRRVMWSTWATEKLWAGGLREFSLCPDDVINIRLPCPEEALETGESVDMDYLQVSLPVTPDLPGGADCNDDAGNGRDSGLLAQCFRLFSMRGRTMRKTKQLLSRPCQPEEIVAAIRDIERQLRSLHKTFGPHTFAREKIALHAKGRWLARYITTCTSWHQCHCDAYRILLSGYYWAFPDDVILRTDRDFVAHCRQQCSEHAQSIIDTLCAVLDLPMELPLMDPDLATCVFQSARILHYVHLKTPNTSQKESWKLYNMLQSCVEVVKKIFGNTPVTAPVISDLQDLVTHGEFRGARERVDNLAEMPPSDPMWRAKSQQLLERHSLVRRANFINDSPDADTATAFNCEATDTSMLTPSSTTARAPCYETANLVGRFWGQLDTSEPAVATSAATAAAGLQQLGSDYARQDAAASLAVGLQMQQYQWDGVCPTPFQDLELLLSSEMHAGGWWPSQDQWNHA